MLGDRFWAKVEKTESCWLWTGVTRRGYGLFTFEGKPQSAHRLSFQWANPEMNIAGLQVCHSCDTPSCVRPEHLFLGTAKINSDDKITKGRHPWQFSDEQVIDMRSREMTVTVCRDLAEEFNTDPQTIKEILLGVRYGWVGNFREVPRQLQRWRLTRTEIVDIYDRVHSGTWGVQTRLAKEYGVGDAMIHNIKIMTSEYIDTLR